MIKDVQIFSEWVVVGDSLVYHGSLIYSSNKMNLKIKRRVVLEQSVIVM